MVKGFVVSKIRTGELIIKDQYNNEVEKIVYNKDTLLIEDIFLYSESLMDYMPIQIRFYKQSYPGIWERLLKKVCEHHYNQLVGESDRREDTIYLNYRDLRAANS